MAIVLAPPQEERASLDESQVARWAQELETLHARVGPRFSRAEPRRQALKYLQGLLSTLERKNSWQLAEAAGERTPRGMQRLLDGARWDPQAVRDDLRGYVLEHLGAQGAWLVLDETGFIKKGRKSAGVARQYSGTAGRIENCQIGVFLGYASARGKALIDRELYLPQEWAQDWVRRAEAGIPPEVRFLSKPQLAQRMLERAFGAGVQAQWVLGDCVYGADPKLRRWLQARGQSYVLGVRKNDSLRVERGSQTGAPSVEAVAAGLAPKAWRRLSAGEGSKGPRWYDWARVPLSTSTDGLWSCWLLVRRSLTDPEDLAYFAVFAPAQTTLAQLAEVAGRRWVIESCFEEAKAQVGLDEYEVRKWTGWYRHITLAMMAHAYLSVVRLHAREADAQKGGAWKRPRDCCR